MTTLADALEQGRLSSASTSGELQTALNIPHARLRPYRDVLLAADDIALLVPLLRVAVETAKQVSAEQPVVEVAWTYPGDTRPGLRTTGGVAREVIDATTRTLLLVGYSVTVDPALTGLAAQTVAAIARAAERGVVVTAVLHRDANRQALLQAWRKGLKRPAIFTWPVSDDAMASLHAKLLIGDRRDGLVTSANLTYHGFERNLEMGLRVTGNAPAEVHDRFHELIASGDLVPWNS